MTSNNTLDLVLQEWVASLKNRQRGKDHVRPNFEDLFDKLKRAGATFDEAHEILPRAVKAHLPPRSVAKNLYKKLKLIPTFDKSEKEYVDEWNKSIEDTATQVFFEFFPLERLDDDNEPKVYGNMSAREYRAQRRYADQFPVIDTTELEKRMHNREYNLDIEDLIKTVLGEDDNG